jgi:adenylate cyclase
MAEKSKSGAALTERMMFIGVGLAAIYWLLEILLDVFLRTDVGLSQRLIGADMSLLWRRLLILCVFVIFGSHAQYTMNERRKAEERRQKEAAARERFQRLLSPDLAEMVVSGKLKVEQGGENRVATVMFADIRGFTELSESIQATDLVKMLNEYYELLVDVVFRQQGTVDKFIGDAMMVIWGAPISQPNDPVRAVRAALEMQSVMVKFNEEQAARGRPQIEIGIGINSGSVVAGYIGSSRTMSYSVIGDTVNTASRLCSAAKPGQILISENTFEQVREQFNTIELEPLRFKGKANQLRIFSVSKSES